MMIVVVQIFIGSVYLVLTCYVINKIIDKGKEIDDKIKKIDVKIKRLKQEIEAIETAFVDYKRTKHKEEVLKNICYAVSKYNN